jgi:hypothetical protein
MGNSDKTDNEFHYTSAQNLKEIRRKADKAIKQELSLLQLFCFL